MKNKRFNSFKAAKTYFHKYCDDYICFLIEDHENDQYMVINEDTMMHLQFEFDLDCTILFAS